MTVWVTDLLRRITLKWSSNFLDKLGDKQVVLQRMYLGRKGNAKFLLKIFQVWKRMLAPHYIRYIQSNYGNAWNTWTKHMNWECSWTQNDDIQTTPFFDPIHMDTHYKMTIIYLCICFILFVQYDRMNRRPNICLFLGYQQIHRR